jgi:hypothetical protein
LGGVEGESLFIDTHGDFSVERVSEMAKSLRSSVLKKIVQLGNETPLTIQFETTVSIPSGNGSSTGGAIKKKAVLFRLSPTFGDLHSTISAGSAFLSENKLNIPQNLHIDAQASRNSNLVNSFYILVAQSFAEILFDVFYTFQLLLTAVSPLRFAALVKMLIEHEIYLPLRVSEYAIDAIFHGDFHILEYRMAISESLNLMVKNARAQTWSIIHHRFRVHDYDFYHF